MGLGPEGLTDWSGLICVYAYLVQWPFPCPPSVDWLLAAVVGPSGSRHAITEGRTTILITHKGSMLTLVDKLILIDRGRLVAYGDKDEVIRKLQARQYGTAAEQTDI